MISAVEKGRRLGRISEGNRALNKIYFAKTIWIVWVKPGSSVSMNENKNKNKILHCEEHNFHLINVITMVCVVILYIIMAFPWKESSVTRTLKRQRRTNSIHFRSLYKILDSYSPITIIPKDLSRSILKKTKKEFPLTIYHRKAHSLQGEITRFQRIRWNNAFLTETERANKTSNVYWINSKSCRLR